MTSFTQTISIPYAPIVSRTGEAVEKKSEESKIEFIEVDDIRDLPLEAPHAGKLSLLSTLGVAPSSIETNNLAVMTAMSLFIATILSIWISNIVFISIFLILAIFTFIISMFTEDKPFRVKIGGLLGDFFIVGMTGTITEYIFHSYTIPILNVPIPIFSGLLLFMIINYMIVDCKRIYPVSTVAKSKFLAAFVISTQHAFEAFKTKFQDTIEDDISGRERRLN